MKGLLILGIAILLLVSAPVTGCADKEQLTEAYNEGYQSGYDEAYTAAYEEGHAFGYDEAYTAAYEEGHAFGYEKGLSEGYVSGYDAGEAWMKRSMEQALDELRREVEEAYEKVEKPTYGDMFYFYYTPLEDQQYGVDNLEACLSTWEWKEESYKANVFDCSEMSAFLEWYLENEGFHTVIVSGMSPDDSGARHAWLLVETSEGKYMPVEATHWSVVLWENPYFDNYFDYEFEFETIQEVLEYAPKGFDWWASSKK